MPGLRETLEAATPGPWLAIRDGGVVAVCDEHGEAEVVPWNEGAEQTTEENARLIALAPELAALVLDMGEALTEIRQNGRPDFGDCGAATCEHPGCLYTRKYDALLARLDQIGAADETRLGKEQT